MSCKSRLAALEDYHKVAVDGCDGCAKACLNAGSDEVKKFPEQLRKQGKQVVLEATPGLTGKFIFKNIFLLDKYIR